MEKLFVFNAREKKLLRKNIENLMIPEEGSLITGFNCYDTLADSSGILISLSYQQRFRDHIAAIIQDIQTDPCLCQIISQERLVELKLERNKRSLYRWDKRWPIPKENDMVPDHLEFLDLRSGNVLDSRKLDKLDIIEELEEYRAFPSICMREKEGLELNLNIKTREEAERVLDLFRKMAFKMKVDKQGLIVYEEGKMVPLTDTWPHSDVVPCIILGKHIIDFFSDAPLGFIPSNKIMVLKDDNEISFVVNKSHMPLVQSKSYKNLKQNFRVEDIKVYVNSAFVFNYINA